MVPRRLHVTLLTVFDWVLCIVGMLYKTVQLYLQIWAAKSSTFSFYIGFLLPCVRYACMFNIASRLFCTMFTNLLAFIIWLFRLVVCCQYNVSIDYQLISCNYFQYCPWYTNSSRFFWIANCIGLSLVPLSGTCKRWGRQKKKHVRDGEFCSF